ncbi:probable calcium-binding protein CML47 [Cucurbita pepo subsp. pepo]|uniref:probable calcium-binding protein CML47 n=1 Tax=Cucurbita pepo subsp. pepo TaxID=3664 RepID=UPI000C9DA6E2|nr:probable calcium-binding protein CML47 [Cucurbita pepo subsp. pepo]
MLLVHPFTLSQMAPIDELDYANPISVFQILFLFFLNFLLEYLFPGPLYVFILCAAFHFYLWNSWVAHRNIIKRFEAADDATCTPSARRNAHVGHCYTGIVGMPVNDAYEVKLTIDDVKTMMEALHNNMETSNLELKAEIEGVFEEELSVGEVKEAFDLFDENGDGFIDAEDLKKVLDAMGFTVASEVDECRRMISGYDKNGDGRLDFEEFAKLVEQSFC